VALYRTGAVDGGRSELELVKRLTGQWPALFNQRAWVLATNANPHVRDGALAVELAQQACAATGNRVPAFLGTLAAAHAEAGRFEEAVAIVKKALAQAGPQSAAAQALQRGLQKYENHEALREQAPH
jgi:hypothetical protein